MSTPIVQQQQTPAQARAHQAQAKLAQTSQQIASHPVVQQGHDIAQRQLNLLDRELAKFGFLNDIERTTKVPKTYGVLGTSVAFVILVFLNLFGLASPVTNLIGWALPAYLSCQALESPQQGDDKQWLTYWVVFGFFNFLESAALRLVLYYVPWYFTLKLAFTIWLMLPATRGAEQVYNSALRPAFQAGKSKVQHASKASYSNTNTTTSSLDNPSTGFSALGSTSPTNATSTGYSTSTNINPSLSGSNNPFAPGSTETSGATVSDAPPKLI